MKPLAPNSRPSKSKSQKQNSENSLDTALRKALLHLLRVEYLLEGLHASDDFAPDELAVIGDFLDEVQLLRIKCSILLRTRQQS